jgi:hypothetical protein
MGAEAFVTEPYHRDNAKIAFKDAVEQAQYDHGHSGYTGTIAEKHTFVMMPIIEGMTIDQSINKYFDDYDPRIDEKWGPAGCIQNEEGAFIFFGWASS